MCFADDAYNDWTLLDSFLCVLDLEYATLRREGDWVVVVVVTEHDGGGSCAVLTRNCPLDFNLCLQMRQSKRRRKNLVYEEVERKGWRSLGCGDLEAVVVVAAQGTWSWRQLGAPVLGKRPSVGAPPTPTSNLAAGG
jgi:hypothetical protein